MIRKGRSPAADPFLAPEGAKWISGPPRDSFSSDDTVVEEGLFSMRESVRSERSEKMTANGIRLVLHFSIRVSICLVMYIRN